MKKLNFIETLIKENKKEPDGTFVAVKLSEDTVNALQEAAKKMNVSNIISPEDMHITLIYSKKHLPNFESQGKINPPIVCMPCGMETFGENNDALVVRVYCPELTARNQQITEEHGATSDYDQYKPHVTLSYDCSGFDVNSHNIMDYMDKPFIEIVEEYHNDLDVDWENK